MTKKGNKKTKILFFYQVRCKEQMFPIVEHLDEQFLLIVYQFKEKKLEYTCKSICKCNSNLQQFQTNCLTPVKRQSFLYIVNHFGHLNVSLIFQFNVVATKWYIKLKSHGILYYFWSADLSKSFALLIVSIFKLLVSTFIFFQYIFQWVLKVWGHPTLFIS